MYSPVRHGFDHFLGLPFSADMGSTAWGFEAWRRCARAATAASSSSRRGSTSSRRGSSTLAPPLCATRARRGGRGCSTCPSTSRTCRRRRRRAGATRRPRPLRRRAAGDGRGGGCADGGGQAAHGSTLTLFLSDNGPWLDMAGRRLGAPVARRQVHDMGGRHPRACRRVLARRRPRRPRCGRRCADARRAAHAPLARRRAAARRCSSTASTCRRCCAATAQRTPIGAASSTAGRPAPAARVTATRARAGGECERVGVGDRRVPGLWAVRCGAFKGHWVTATSSACSQVQRLLFDVVNDPAEAHRWLHLAAGGPRVGDDRCGGGAAPCDAAGRAGRGARAQPGGQGAGSALPSVLRVE